MDHNDLEEKYLIQVGSEGICPYCKWRKDCVQNYFLGMICSKCDGGSPAFIKQDDGLYRKEIVSFEFDKDGYKEFWKDETYDRYIDRLMAERI